MPFDFDETSPADSASVSSFPANERNARAAVHDAFEIDHEEATGEHKKATLQEQSSDPTNAANKGHVYTKDVSGVTELFYRASNGDIYQLTIGGFGPNDALLRAAGASAAQRTMAAALLLNNTIALQGKEAGGTLRDLIKMTASDVIQVGNTTTATQELLVNALSGLIARHAGGTARILTVDDEGTGNGLDADTVDAIEGADTLNDASGNYAEVEFTGLAAASRANNTHGLGGQPRLVNVFMECTTADDGYAIGDRIPLAIGCEMANNVGITVWWNATSCGYARDNDIELMNKSTGTSDTAIDKSDWKIVFQLWK